MKAFHEVRSYDSDFRVWYSHYDNIGFLAHWHREIEFIYVRSGLCPLRIQDFTFTARAGDLAVCESGLVHFCDSRNLDNSLDFLIFDPSILDPLCRNPGFLNPLIKKEQLSLYGLSETLTDLIDKVSSELTRRDPYYKEVVSSLIRSFWALLRRNHPSAGTDAFPDDRHQRMLSDLQNLVSYIDNHYAENISLDIAAKRMNFSNSYFSRLFMKIMGVHFVTYLNMVRIEHAAYELLHTDHKITEIAMNCGFNNIRTFNRVFKEINGCTPSEFLLQPNRETFTHACPDSRSDETEFVENDSVTLVKNSASYY